MKINPYLMFNGNCEAAFKFYQQCLGGERTFGTAWMINGDLSIAPAQTPLFARWQDEDQFLEIRIAARFLERVLRETLDKNSDQIEPLSEFRLRA